MMQREKKNTSFRCHVESTLIRLWDVHVLYDYCVVCGRVLIPQIYNFTFVAVTSPEDTVEQCKALFSVTS